MRKAAALWLLLAAFCGTVLLYTSQKVNDGREKIVVLEQDIRLEEESLRVLQAEWSYLNQPDRLEKLAREHLNLAPMQGKQFAKIEDIPVKVETAAPLATSAEVLPKAEVVAKPTPVKTVVKPPQTVKIKPKEKSPATVQRLSQPSGPVIKRPPQQTTAQRQPVTPAPQPRRDFGDVIQSLGVD